MDATSRARSSKKLEQFAPGDVLFTEKSPGTFFYLIQEGHVEVYITRQYEDIPIAIVKAGQCLGEFSVLDGQTRSASARALSNVTAVKVDAQMITTEFDKIAPWLKAIIRSLVDRIRKTDDILRRNKVVDQNLMDQIQSTEYKKVEHEGEGDKEANPWSDGKDKPKDGGGPSPGAGDAFKSTDAVNKEDVNAAKGNPESGNKGSKG